MNAKKVIDEMWELSGDLMNPHVEITPGGARYGSRTGTLDGNLSDAEITKILGFEPERYGADAGKVTIRWRFKARVDGGPVSQCAIWDYKGARFSTGGASEVFNALFGQKYSAMFPQGEPYGYQF